MGRPKKLTVTVLQPRRGRSETEDQVSTPLGNPNSVNSLIVTALEKSGGTNVGAKSVAKSNVRHSIWVDKVTNSAVGMELHSIPDACSSGVVVIEVEDIQSELVYWQNTLVGQFIGGKPSIAQVKEFVKKQWTHTPHLWSAKALSKIASQIGTPLYVDPVTTNKGRLSFDRIMVEVDLAKPLPDFVAIHTPFLGQILQGVEYEWLPFYCTHCKKLGHEEKVCKKKKKETSPSQGEQVSVSGDVLVAKPTVIILDNRSVPVQPIVTKVVGVTRASGRKVVDTMPDGGGQSAHALPNSSWITSTELVPGTQEETGGGESQAQFPVSPNQFALLEVQAVEAEKNPGHMVPQKLQNPVITQIQVPARSWAEQEVRDVDPPPPVFSMNIGVWNIRGMNKLLKQSEVISLFNSARLDILGIVETRIRKNKANNVQRRQFKHFFVLDNYSSHLNKRIWIIWKNSNMVVTVHHSTSQWIHLLVTNGALSMELTFVYGFNHPTQRLPLWEFMVDRHQGQLPWMLLGDFNYVRTLEERISSDPPNLVALGEFNEAIANARLVELNTQGCTFTWTNKQEYDDCKWMKLDRALVNSSWLLAYPDSSVEVLTSGISDHSPLVVNLGIRTQDKQFLPLVKREWRRYIRGCPMFRFIQHLHGIKNQLKSLHKDKYSSISERVTQLQQALHICQLKVHNDPTNMSLHKEEEMHAKAYCKLKNIELNIAYQRAKEFDIKQGDAGTAYFFSKVAAIRNTANISKVMDVHGHSCTDMDGISRAFLEY
ncbi:uncharacterized protein LOC141608064 [Silene latifolia]|uniref:uncharacterized protein LOC141608064 n=1 Tax=Silene latifolia TaxID=37657 RepID=UPI003D77E95C